MRETTEEHALNGLPQIDYLIRGERKGSGPLVDEALNFDKSCFWIEQSQDPLLKEFEDHILTCESRTELAQLTDALTKSGCDDLLGGNKY
jgi:hypothetical protein